MASVTTLAFGLGANVTIFGFVNAIVLRPLEVREPERPVRIDAGRTNRMPLVLESDYEAYRDRNQTLDRLAMFHHGWVTSVPIQGVIGWRGARTNVAVNSLFDSLSVARGRASCSSRHGKVRPGQPSVSSSGSRST